MSPQAIRALGYQKHNTITNFLTEFGWPETEFGYASVLAIALCLGALVGMMA